MTDLVDAEIAHYPGFLRDGERQSIFAQLRDTTPWEQHVVRIFGKSHPAPRLSAWYGDPGATYTYSGLQLSPQPWTPRLDQLRQRVSTLTSKPFNSALLNYYRDGADGMGWHSDDEPELGRNPCIASLSLGSERRFLLRHKTQSNLPTSQYLLGDGDLLIMQGKTQHYWKHQIPKTRRPVGPRINITFRYVHVTRNQEAQSHARTQ